jgi:hypothetical protein
MLLSIKFEFFFAFNNNHIIDKSIEEGGAFKLHFR